MQGLPWKKGTVLAVLLWCASVTGLWAAGVDQVVRDMTPQAGVVVMQIGGEYLIDLDASKGIRVGDLVSVMQPGEKIVHPVTHEVIGSLDTVKAVLRVTRVKSGYSYAALLPGGGAVSKGDPIRTFTGIPATFWDYTGSGEDLFAQLQAGLPELEWQPYGLAQQQKPEKPGPVPGLKGVVFVLTAQGLGVRGSGFQPINFYPSAALNGPTAATAAMPAAPVVASTPVLPTATPAIIKAPLPATGAGVIQDRRPDQQGVWYGPDMPGLMVGVAVGNFNGTGGNQVAIAFPNKVLIGHISNGQYQGDGFLDIDSKYRILSIDAADLDHDGKDELYMSAAEQSIAEGPEAIASLYAEVADGAMRIKQKEIPYLLGVVEVPGEGRVLLGQRAAETGATYSGPLFRFVKKGEKLERGPEFNVPTDKASVQGLAITKAADGKPLYVLLDINEKLEVYSADGDQLWDNGDVVGGTESYFRRPGVNPRDTDMAYEYLKARLAVTKDGLILVPFNEGSTRMFKYRDYTKGSLTAYRWDGRSLQEEWHTAPQGGSLTGFAYADVDNDGKDEVVTSVIFNHGNALSPGLARSALVVYELP